MISWSNIRKFEELKFNIILVRSVKMALNFDLHEGIGFKFCLLLASPTLPNIFFFIKVRQKVWFTLIRPFV